MKGESLDAIVKRKRSRAPIVGKEYWLRCHQDSESFDPFKTFMKKGIYFGILDSKFIFLYLNDAPWPKNFAVERYSCPIEDYFEQRAKKGGKGITAFYDGVIPSGPEEDFAKERIRTIRQGRKLNRYFRKT